MKVLITGATGLIGRHLVHRMASRHELVCTCRSDSNAELSEIADWVRVDLAEPIDPKRLPPSVDGIVHLAQSDRFRDFPDGVDDLFAVNVRSTHDLLEYGRAAGARAFVLASTGGCYAPGPAPITEDAPLEPPGPYFRSKRMAELLAENYADLLGGAILRFFFVYGPGPGARLVTRLAQQIEAGDEIVIDGDPGMRLNPIFADDAAAAIEAALGLERQDVINVAGTEIVTVTELMAKLATAMDRETSVRHTSREIPDLVANIYRMRDRLGVTPATTLPDGLAAVAQWLARAEPARVSGSTRSR